MKAFGSALATFLLASIAFGASSPVGTYQCDDEGTLEVAPGTESGRVYASLGYADGSASTLAEFEFVRDSAVGTMLRDDEDGREMGTVTHLESERALRLDLGGGDIVVCRSADRADVGDEGLLHQAKVSVTPGYGYPPPYRPYPYPGSGGYYHPRPPVFVPPPYYPRPVYPRPIYPRPVHPYRRW